MKEMFGLQSSAEIAAEKTNEKLDAVAIALAAKINGITATRFGNGLFRGIFYVDFPHEYNYIDGAEFRRIPRELVPFYDEWRFMDGIRAARVLELCKKKLTMPATLELSYKEVAMPAKYYHVKVLGFKVKKRYEPCGRRWRCCVKN